MDIDETFFPEELSFAGLDTAVASTSHAATESPSPTTNTATTKKPRSSAEIMKALRTTRMLTKLIDEHDAALANVRAAVKNDLEHLSKAIAEPRKTVQLHKNHIFHYPYFKDAGGSTTLFENDDSRSMTSNWESGMGVNVYTSRRSARRWSTGDRLCLLRAVDEQYVDTHKRMPLQKRINEIDVRLSTEFSTLALKTTARRQQLALRAEMRDLHDRLYAVDTQHVSLEEDLARAGRSFDAASVDWADIAHMKMGGRYTPDACRTKYVNCLAPWSRNAEPWSSNERLRLMAAVLRQRLGNTQGRIDWHIVADEVACGRTPWVVFRKFMRHLHPHTTNMSEKWTEVEDEQLRLMVRQFQRRVDGKINFMAIAYLLGTRTLKSVRWHYDRALFADDNTVNKGMWSHIENEALTKAIKVYGEQNWKPISEFIGTRTAIQAREHWVLWLRGGYVSGAWFGDEDDALLAAVDVLGAGKWARVQQDYLPHRAAHIIKNRWTSLQTVLKRRLDVTRELCAEYSVDVDALPFDPHGRKAIDMTALGEWLHANSPRMDEEDADCLPRRALLLESLRVAGSFRAPNKRLVLGALHAPRVPKTEIESQPNSPENSVAVEMEPNAKRARVAHGGRVRERPPVEEDPIVMRKAIGEALHALRVVRRDHSKVLVPKLDSRATQKLVRKSSHKLKQMTERDGQVQPPCAANLTAAFNAKCALTNAREPCVQFDDANTQKAVDQLKVCWP